jgi:hypothetical protein
MKKLNLSGFDLGVIIAFAVLTLMGVGAWWYLSGALQDAVAQTATAKANFDKYSTKYSIVVSRTSGKARQANIDVLKAQLDPLIHTTLQSSANKLHSIQKEDPVAWKHDLDDEVRSLTAAAKLHSVTLPNNFYFGFSRYQSQGPNDEQTVVLSKQLLGVEQLATILINAPVNGIQAIRRTYEEDSHTSRGAGPGAVEGDRLAGFSLSALGGVSPAPRTGGAAAAPTPIYTAYPFEVDLETTSENLRPVIDNLVQSPYIFVIRTLTIENSVPNSPVISDLDRLAGPPPSSVLGTSPGEVAAAPVTKGPQYLFGNSILKVKIRVDMIEWDTDVTVTASSAATPGGQPKPPTGGK